MAAPAGPPILTAVVPPTRPWLIDVAAIGLVGLGTFQVCAGLLTLGFWALMAWFALLTGGLGPAQLLVFGLGGVLIATGVIEWVLARGILARSVRSRIAAIALTALFALLSAQSALAAVGTTNFPELVVVPVANVVVFVTLLAARDWFARPVDRPSVASVSGGRRRLFTLCVLVTVVLVLSRFATAIGPQGDDRSLAYLRTLPEATLAYPDAVPQSRSEHAASTGLTSQSLAMTEQRYRASASADQVSAWYAERLTAEGWVREHERWHKGFALLSLSFESVDATDIMFAVRIDETNLGLDQAPLTALRDLSAIELAYPDSSVTDEPSERGRVTASSIIHEATIGRHYRTFATVDQVFAFYERELRKDGWVVERSDNPGRRSWRLGAATLKVVVKQRDADRPYTDYDVTISEILGPDITPGLPWE